MKFLKIFNFLLCAIFLSLTGESTSAASRQFCFDILKDLTKAQVKQLPAVLALGQAQTPDGLLWSGFIEFAVDSQQPRPPLSFATLEVGENDFYLSIFDLKLSTKQVLKIDVPVKLPEKSGKPELRVLGNDRKGMPVIHLTFEESFYIKQDHAISFYLQQQREHLPLAIKANIHSFERDSVGQLAGGWGKYVLVEQEKQKLAIFELSDWTSGYKIISENQIAEEPAFATTPAGNTNVSPGLTHYLRRGHGDNWWLNKFASPNANPPATNRLVAKSEDSKRHLKLFQATDFFHLGFADSVSDIAWLPDGRLVGQVSTSQWVEGQAGRKLDLTHELFLFDPKKARKTERLSGSYKDIPGIKIGEARGWMEPRRVTVNDSHRHVPGNQGPDSIDVHSEGKFVIPVVASAQNVPKIGYTTLCGSLKKPDICLEILEIGPGNTAENQKSYSLAKLFQKGSSTPSLILKKLKNNDLSVAQLSISPDGLYASLLIKDSSDKVPHYYALTQKL